MNGGFAAMPFRPSAVLTLGRMGMFFRKMCYSFAGLILVASIQGCGKTEGPKTVVSPPASVPTAAVKFTNPIQAEDLTGNWAAGTGQASVEKLPDGSLKLVNDKKDVSSGRINGGILNCKEWSVTGQLSLDKKSLVWSNGSAWNR